MHFQKHFKYILPIAILGMLSFLAPCSFRQYSPAGSVKITAKFPGKAVNSGSSRLVKPLAADETYVPQFVDKISLTLSKDGEEPITITNQRDTSGQLSNSFENIPEIKYGTYKLEIACYICASGGTKPDYRDCPEANWKLTHTSILENLNISPLNLSGTVTAELNINSGTVLDETPLSHSGSYAGLRNAIDVDSNGNFIICKPNSQDGENFIDIYAYDAHGSQIAGTLPMQTGHGDNYFTDFNFCKISGNTIVASYLKNSEGLVDLLLERINFNVAGPLSNTVVTVIGGLIVVDPHPALDIDDSYVVIAWEKPSTPEKISFRTFTLDLIPLIEPRDTECNGGICTKPEIKTMPQDKFAILFYNELGGSSYLGGNIVNSPDAKSIVSKDKLTDDILDPLSPTFSFDSINDDQLILFYDNSYVRKAVFLDSNLNWIRSPSEITFTTDTMANINAPRADIYNYFNNNIIAFWREPNDQINYGLINESLEGGQITKLNLGSSAQGGYYLSLNEDGFGIIAWTQFSSTVRFQRFIF